MSFVKVTQKLYCDGESLSEAIENGEVGDHLRVVVNPSTIDELLSRTEGNVRRDTFKKSSNKYTSKINMFASPVPGHLGEFGFRPSQCVMILNTLGVLARGMHTTEAINGLLSGEKGEDGVSAVQDKIISVNIDIDCADAVEVETKNQGKFNESKLLAQHVDATENQITNAREALEAVCYAFSRRGRTATDVGAIGAAKLQVKFPELFARFNDSKAIGIKQDRNDGTDIRQLRPSLQGLSQVFCDLLGVSSSVSESIFEPENALNIASDEWRVSQRALVKNELTKLDKVMRRSKKEGSVDGSGKGTIREEGRRLLSICLNIKAGRLDVSSISPSRYNRPGLSKNEVGMTSDLIDFVQWVCEEFTGGEVRDNNATLEA